MQVKFSPLGQTRNLWLRSKGQMLKFNYFLKKSSGIPNECQTVWIQIRTDVGLIWVQTVYKGYQQTTLVGKEIKVTSLYNMIYYC